MMAGPAQPAALGAGVGRAWAPVGAHAAAAVHGGTDPGREPIGREAGLVSAISDKAGCDPAPGPAALGPAPGTMVHED
jgi:hypothetical protein